MSALQRHQSAMAAVSDPRSQAPIDTIAELKAVISKLEKENGELRAAVHRASMGSARQWQDRCCAQAETIKRQAKLIDELRSGNG